MNRHVSTLLTLATTVVLAAGSAAGQGTAAPTAPASGQLPTGRPRLVAPVRGTAEVGYTKPVVRAAKIDGRDFIVTTIRVRNMATAPIAGFKVDEFWYDKGGNPVTGASFRSPKPIPAGEVIEVKLETPRNPQMNSNTYKFSHSNGEVKTTLLPKL